MQAILIACLIEWLTLKVSKYSKHWSYKQSRYASKHPRNQPNKQVSHSEQLPSLFTPPPHIRGGRDGGAWINVNYILQNHLEGSYFAIQWSWPGTGGGFLSVLNSRAPLQLHCCQTLLVSLLTEIFKNLIISNPPDCVGGPQGCFWDII